jgi:hypothetical protein
MHFDLRTIEEHKGILHECLVLPSQWNCFHLSCEQKLSGTLEIVENHEALGKDIHFHKDPLGYKRVHIFSWTEHTQSVRLKAVPQNDFNTWTYIVKINELKIEQENTHTHMHTHTQSADILFVN